MTWNKTWYSRIMWACSFALTVSILLFGVSGIYLDKYQIAEKYNILPGYNRMVWLLVCCLLFLMISLFVFLLLRLMRGRFQGTTVSKNAKVAIEGLCFTGLLAGGILYRLSSFPSEIAANPYFELAWVTDKSPVEPMAHGALYIYILLLRGLFFLVGNHAVAGVILQIVLQFVSSVIIYIALRKTAGVIAALWSFGFLMFAPYFASTGYTPKEWYLFLFSLVLLVWSCILNMVQKANMRKWYHFLWAFLYGICVAVLIYLDALGLVLVCMSLGMLGMSRENKVSVITVYLVSLFASLLGLVGIFTADALLSHSSLTDVMGVWEWLFALQSSNWYYGFSQILYVLGDNLLVCCLIFVGLFWALFGFFNEKKTECLHPFMWMMLAGTLLSYMCAASGNMDRSFLGMLGMIVLAGKGIELTFAKKEVEPMLAEEIMEGTPAEETEFSTAETENLTAEIEAEATSTVSEGEQITENTEQTADENVMVSDNENQDVEGVLCEDTAEPAREIVYIDNPLPLPKKHIKKTMDYGVEVAEEDLKFDIEVSDDDDFDI